MKKYNVTVVEDDRMFNTKAWTCGQMASGEMTWEYEGMEENAIYTACRLRNPETGKMQYVLFRQ